MPCCKIDRKERIDRDKFTFKCTDESYLFFKNVRQIFYDFQDLPRARWHAYRYSDRYKGVDRPFFNPVIVVDWSRLDASILIEPNEVLQEEATIAIREKNSKSGRFYQYTLAERGKDNMLEFATKIYEAIIADNKVYVSFQGRYVELFQEEDDAENFRVVMADYYRLTRVF